MMKKVVVLGSGGWGIAFSIMADKIGHNVSVWTPFLEEKEDILSNHEHKKLLPGVKIPESIEITNDIQSVSSAEIVIIAVPSSVVAQTAERIKNYVSREAIIVSLSKGLDGDRIMLLSDVIHESLPNNKLCVLSGPSHAEEVARNMPTAVVVSSYDEQVACEVQTAFSCDTFRIYTSTDVVGVETAGAIKNVMALAAGILDGLGYQDNTKAALMTRGISEIRRLGEAMGGKPATFLGLAGIGDLIVTCTSMHSRNRRAGILLGQGCSAEETLNKIGMTVEGYATTKAAYSFAVSKNVEMPIVTEVYNVLYNGKSAKQALTDLLKRPLKSEEDK